MTKETKPNHYVPFDLDRGCTFNNSCPSCKKPTWMSEDPYQTLSEGFTYRDKLGKVVGILQYKDINGIYCEDCYGEKK